MREQGLLPPEEEDDGTVVPGPGAAAEEATGMLDRTIGLIKEIIGRPWQGIPTPPSSLFLGRFAPVFRRFFAVPLHCPASWRRDGENGRKMAENGRNLGEKRARNSGG
eukprot:COSAG04_NODE_1823_length_5490_cov_4.159866_3_plen_108_part_00